MSFEYQKKGLETHYENGSAARAGALQGRRRYCTVDMYSILIMSLEYQKRDSKLLMGFEYQEMYWKSKMRLTPHIPRRSKDLRSAHLALATSTKGSM